jgi:hypothetical protein
MRNLPENMRILHGLSLDQSRILWKCAPGEYPQRAKGHILTVTQLPDPLSVLSDPLLFMRRAAARTASEQAKQQPAPGDANETKHSAPEARSLGGESLQRQRIVKPLSRLMQKRGRCPQRSRLLARMQRQDDPAVGLPVHRQEFEAPRRRGALLLNAAQQHRFMGCRQIIDAPETLAQRLNPKLTADGTLHRRMLT